MTLVVYNEAAAWCSHLTKKKSRKRKKSFISILKKKTIFFKGKIFCIYLEKKRLVWWPMRAKLFLRTILILKVNFTFMFNLNLKINLKLNFKFISNSVSFENQFKFHFISVFYFKLTSKAFLLYFLF